MRHLKPHTSQQTVPILKDPYSSARGVLMGRLSTLDFVTTGVSMAVYTTTTTAINEAIF